MVLRVVINLDLIRKGFAYHLWLSDHMKWLLELLPRPHILLLLNPPSPACALPEGDEG